MFVKDVHDLEAMPTSIFLNDDDDDDETVIMSDSYNITNRQAHVTVCDGTSYDDTNFLSFSENGFEQLYFTKKRQ